MHRLSKNIRLPFASELCCEVWELEENVWGRDSMSDELLLTQVRGRRWVHDMKLVEKGAATEVASDLPDKPVGGGKLGC